MGISCLDLSRAGGESEVAPGSGGSSRGEQRSDYDSRRGSTSRQGGARTGVVIVRSMLRGLCVRWHAAPLCTLICSTSVCVDMQRHCVRWHAAPLQALPCSASVCIGMQRDCVCWHAAPRCALACSASVCVDMQRHWAAPFLSITLAKLFFIAPSRSRVRLSESSGGGAERGRIAGGF